MMDHNLRNVPSTKHNSSPTLSSVEVEVSRSPQVTTRQRSSKRTHLVSHNTINGSNSKENMTEKVQHDRLHWHNTLKTELLKNNQEMQITCELLQEEKTSLRAVIDRLEQQNEFDSQMVNILQGKVNKLKPTSDGGEKDARKKQEEMLDTYIEEKWDALSRFAIRNFPHSRVKQETSYEIPLTKKHMSFLTLIEKLIWTWKEFPSDPWIEVTENIWPPHLELLLRFEIAVRHSENPRRIRIQSYDE